MCSWNGEEWREAIRDSSWRGCKAYIGALETTPWSNDMLEEFAEQAIQHEELGHHNGTDLLTISFSANDHLGHAVGPDDPAVEELAVTTDQAIGRLIDAAANQVGGSQNLLVVMTADHGVAPVPEINVARKMPGARVDKEAYTRAVENALDSRFGNARWIIGSRETGFYFDQNLICERKLNPSDVEDEAARAVENPYVERTYTRTQLLHRQAMTSIPDDYVARSFFPSRGPDLFVVFKPYWLFGKTGTSHGITTHMSRFCSSAMVSAPARSLSAWASRTLLLHWLRCSMSRHLPATSVTSFRRSSLPHSLPQI